MPQDFTPGSPATASELLSEVIRDNFAALESSNSGELEPVYGADGSWWYKPSTRVLYFYSVDHYEPLVEFSPTGAVLKVLDPRTLTLLNNLFLTQAASQVINRNPDDSVSTIVATLPTGETRTTTINRDPDGSVSSVVTSIPALSLSQTKTINRDSNGLVSTVVLN